MHRETVIVHDGQQDLSTRLLPSLRHTLAAQGDALAVGDWVLAVPDAQGQPWLHERLVPRLQLARRLHDGRDKVERVVIVSNVDVAFLVMGLDHDFNLRRLERYTMLARLAGVQAVVVLTKADIAPDAARRLAQAQAVLPPATPCMALSALGDEPRQWLDRWIGPGRTAVLLGSSGAGKSTLTNALVGQAVQRTGASRDADGRGRHTTTARSLRAAAAGGCIIDTPGLRTLRLDTDGDALQQAFGDVTAQAAACRFRNCRHAGEPGCAVSATVDGQRLATWHKLQREAARDTMSALERKAQRNQWKQRGRAGRARLEAKRAERE